MKNDSSILRSWPRLLLCQITDKIKLPFTLIEPLVTCHTTLTTRLRCTIRPIFTLIELLVVIAIMSILMAILLPALKKAQDKTWQTMCMNNQKQINSAAHMYTMDWNDNFPSYNIAGQKWYQQLSYNGSMPGKLLYAPASLASVSNVGGENLWGKSPFVCPRNPCLWEWLTNYGWNYYFNDQGASTCSTKVQFWKKPATTIMLSDIGTPFYNINTGSSDLTLSPTWHFMGGNTMFIDGHCEWFKAGAIIPNKTNLLRGL